MLSVREAQPACRDCGAGALGGPADNPLTAFDALCPASGCADPGQPQVLVNTATLNLYVRIVDLSFGGPAPALVLEQSYNSDSTTSGPLGNGWSFSLGDTLTQAADSSWALLRGSGRVDRFGPSADPSQFFAITSTTDVLTRNADGTLSLRNPRANTVRTFDAGGRLLSIADAGVTRVTLRYSGGQLTSALPRGSAARPVQFTYTGDGHIATIADHAGRTVSFTYDGGGNLVQQTNADGSTIAFSYDSTGRLAGVGQTVIAYGSDPNSSAVANVTLPDGSTRGYAAPGGRQVQVTDGAGNVTSYTSTAPGQTQSIADAAGNTTSYTYDSSGRRTATNNANNGTVQFTYDAAGNLTAVTDPAQNHWTGAYSSGNLTKFTDAGNNSWQLTYDSAGRLTVLTDPFGNANTATRNAAGLVTALSDPNGSRSTFQYDADGVLNKWVDPLGGNWSYQYDGALNVSSRTEPDGSVRQANYDVANRLQSVTSATGSVNFDYSGIQRDSMNRIAQVIDSFGNQVSYTYNTSGALAALGLPGGNTINYQYDVAGRLAKVTDWLGDFAIYKYDATGLVSSVSISAGPVTAYQYDRASNLTALISNSPASGAVAAAYRYTTDANGNRLTANAAEPSTAPLAIPSAALSYNLANQVTGSSAGRTYRYDSSGRPIEVDGAGTTTFSYDASGRVAAAGAAQYTYGGVGLRVERDAAGTARRFVYDISRPRPRLLLETDGSNNPVAWYVWGLGVLWKITAGGQIYFYHYDGDGNVVAVSSATSGIVNRYRYDPLGNLIASDEAVDNSLHARGQNGWVDDGNGLLYGDGNFYLPELRRTLPGMVSLDPPKPAIAPFFSGAGACFTEGVGQCAVSAGRRTQ